MTYKTKIGIAIGVGFGFIIVMSIVMAVFVSNNSGTGKVAATNNVQNNSNLIENNINNNESKTQELIPNTEIEMDFEDVYSIGVKNENDKDFLVKISDDLSYEDVVELNSIEGFIGYDLQDENVYLAYNQDENSIIYSINLNDNTFSLEAELENQILNSFYVYENNIYYLTTDNSIFKYNLEEKIEEEICTPEENGTIVSFEFDKENNRLFLMENITENEQETMYVYKFNLDDNTKEEILNAGFKGEDLLLHNNYLICNLLNTSFYVFNIENNSLWELRNYRRK